MNKGGGSFGSGGGIKPPHGHNSQRGGFGQGGGHPSGGGGIIDGGFVKRHTQQRAIKQNEAFTFVGETDGFGDNSRRQPKEKKETKYPIFTEILELHDKMQSLHASGSSFVEQSTMDITESDYMLLPFRLITMSVKGLMYVGMGFFLFLILDFLYCFYLGKWVNFNIFIPPIILICCFFHFFFNQYFLASTKQFVIVGEKIPRTTRFYNSIKNIWSAGEMLILIITGLSIILFLYKEQIAVKIQPLFLFLAKYTKNPLFSELDKIQLFLSSFAISWIALCCLEFIFKMSWRKKFDDLQRKNMRSILLQHNRGYAIDEVLRGRI